MALLESGRVEKGIDHIRKAIELKPDYVDAHFSLGLAMISERSGKIGEAISHLEAILKVEPDNPLAKQNLTRLRAMKKAFR